MNTLGAALWTAALLAVIGSGLAAAVVASRRRRRREIASPEPAAGTEPCPLASNPDVSAQEIVRFDVHVFFAEAKGKYVVVDALADVTDRCGAVFGTPVSLILARPNSAMAVNMLLKVLDNARPDHCQVELDLTRERASLKLLPPGRKLSIPVEAASGLPIAS